MFGFRVSGFGCGVSDAGLRVHSGVVNGGGSTVERLMVVGPLWRNEWFRVHCGEVYA